MENNKDKQIAPEIEVVVSYNSNSSSKEGNDNEEITTTKARTGRTRKRLKWNFLNRNPRLSSKPKRRTLLKP